MTAANYDDILARYKRMRSVGRKLNRVLPDYVATEAIEAAGRKLGFWKRDMFVFNTEDHAAVLIDHAIHGCFEGGKNAVDRYAAACPPKPGSDEEALLAAMRRVFFSLFMVEEIVDGVGIRALDIIQDRGYFMADVNLSRSAVVGGIMASRVIPFEGFIMTTGAGFPLDQAVLEEVQRYIEGKINAPHAKPEMTREENAEMAGELIKRCLASTGAPSIEYREIDEAPDERVIPLSPAKPTIGRNDPCPCGSGKKYKKCCGRERGVRNLFPENPQIPHK